MKKSNISYKKAGFSNLIADYLDKKNSLEDLYSEFPTLESFEKTIAAKSKTPINRKVLVEQLIIQNKAEINSNPQLKINIEKLNNSNCYTVTTGHQLCLFTGPLYFIYKTITTINLAKELTIKYPNQQFVPVFWLATEDHDFEEANHFNVFGKKIEWERNWNGYVGEIDNQGLENVFNQFSEIIGDADFSNELKQLFKDCYLNTKNYTEANRKLLYSLFGKHNLVVIDGNDEILKQEFEPIVKADIFENNSFKNITESNSILASKGYKIQVNPRKINFFYQHNNQRNRIVKENNNYLVLNTDLSFTKEELERELENNSQNFSPNVVMRGLYQETILPNLGYIGGGGELAYWFQLKTTFEHYLLPFPLLVLRNSVLWIDKINSKKLNKLNSTATQLFDNTDAFIKEYVQQNTEAEIDFSSERTAILKEYESLLKKAIKIDKSLEGTVKAETQKQVKGLDNLESRIFKAEKRNQETVINQIKNLKSKLFPNGSLQERYDNFSMIYSKNGIKFIDTLIAELEPLNFNFTILKEEEN